jgi:hypothetical protein
MRKLKSFILFIALALISCERDDICAETTATTPRLLIEFYDAIETEDLKSVPRITVYGEGLVLDESGLEIEPIESSDATILFNENATSVELPLVIVESGNETTIRYIIEKDTNLRLDTDDTTNSNIDVIEITYTTEFIYVSRACGYKSIFNALSINVDVADSDTWINNIEVIETTINNENTIHVSILH